MVYIAAGLRRATNMSGFPEASRAKLMGQTMTLAGPPDNAFFPNGNVTGPTGSPMKRAKVMHTTGSSVDTTAPYPEFGGKASNSRVYDHGETNSFVPLTHVVAMGDVTAYTSSKIFAVNTMLSAGTVLDARHIKLPPEQGYGAYKQMSKIEMPLPLVSDALIFKNNGIDTATFTVAVEGRALINADHLAGNYREWKAGDKLVWQPPANFPYHPSAKSVWKLKRQPPGLQQVHAIVFNEFVGGGDEGYVMVFIVAMP